LRYGDMIYLSARRYLTQHSVNFRVFLVATPVSGRKWDGSLLAVSW
jgi:hypothetical protein